MTETKDLCSLIDMASFLKHVPIFHRLSPDYLASLANIAETVRVEQGGAVFHQDDPGDSLYIVKQGEISIQIKNREIAVMKEFDCLGELALLNGMPRSAAAIARNNAELIRVSSDNLKKLLTISPLMSLALMRTIAQRLRQREATRTWHDY